MMDRSKLIIENVIKNTFLIEYVINPYEIVGFTDKLEMFPGKSLWSIGNTCPCKWTWAV